jgi:hypothetical protein
MGLVTCAERNAGADSHVRNQTVNVTMRFMAAK